MAYDALQNPLERLQEVAKLAWMAYVNAAQSEAPAAEQNRLLQIWEDAFAILEADPFRRHGQI